MKLRRLQRSARLGPLHFIIFALALLIAACGGGGDGGPVPQAQAAPAAVEWEIGAAVGMPPHPTPHPEGWAIELPQAPGKAGYITKATGPLAGKSRIVLTYRVEGVIHATKAPDSTGILTLYFQRAGDCWTAQCEDYRWWATFATQTLRPGTYTVTAPLDANWTAVLASSRATNPGGFLEALQGTARVGFTLGGGDGYGHGVYAIGPARIVVLSFEVQ